MKRNTDRALNFRQHHGEGWRCEIRDEVKRTRSKSGQRLSNSGHHDLEVLKNVKNDRYASKSFNATVGINLVKVRLECYFAIFPSTQTGVSPPARICPRPHLSRYCILIKLLLLIWNPKTWILLRISSLVFACGLHSFIFAQNLKPGFDKTKYMDQSACLLWTWVCRWIEFIRQLFRWPDKKKKPVNPHRNISSQKLLRR